MGEASPILDNSLIEELACKREALETLRAQYESLKV
jgi:hypothetical protein